MADRGVLRTSHGGRQLSLTAIALSGLLLLVAGGVQLSARASGTQLSAATPTAPRAAPAVANVLPPGFAKPVAATTQHVPPVELAIPVVSIRSRLVGLRLNNDGTVQVPQDYGAAGWYADGPAPGDPGSPAILIGHVDSASGPGIFFRLTQVKVGDAILIRSADGQVLRFVVYAAKNYAKTTFPAKQIYAGGASPEIRVITCTGTFDQATKHYESNLVVSARLAAAPSKPAPKP